MIGYIYITINLINGKTYVGQYTGKDKNYKGSGQNIKKALKKYGKDNFHTRIIINNITNQLFLDELEKHYIQLYSPARTPNSYNISDGGQGPKNWKPNKEQIEKMRKASLERFKDPAERLKAGNGSRGKKMLPQTKEALIKSNIGNQWNKGKHLSQETKDKLSKTFTGRAYTEQQRKNMSDGRLGMRFSEEHKKSLSDAKIGKSIGGRPIYQIDKDNNIIGTFKSTMEAVEKTGITRASIQRGLKGSQDKVYYSKGYMWKYQDKMEVTNA